jgi:dTDP-4-dehydrorhamnose 3,5-epimerase
MNFSIEETGIEGLVVVKPRVFRDPRGFFMETFRSDTFQALGLPAQFLQDNLSKSSKGIVRGLHYQAPPFDQGKLVTALVGTVLDVVVDIRKNSPTYGETRSFLLSDEEPCFVFVPSGFAHGFSVLSDMALFHYKCTNVYDKASEGGILWNDPDLAIDWQVENPLVSDKDKELPLFKNFSSPF